MDVLIREEGKQNPGKRNNILVEMTSIVGAVKGQ